MNVRLLLVLALALGTASPSALAARAGELLFIVGDVQIENRGNRFAAFSGAPVEVGDTVHTGADGRTQLMMGDGALIFLRPNSSFMVEAMTLPSNQQAAPVVAAAPTAQAQPGSGKVVMSLLRGGLRTISGFIGKRRGDEYRLRTPVATIGIRGTDYTAVYCSANCAGAADGLHLSVSKGQIVIANNGGQLDLYSSQYAYVGSTGDAPSRTTEPSPALQDPLPGGGEGADEDAEPPSGDGGAYEPPAQELGGSPESVPPTPVEELIPLDPRKRSYAFASSDPEQVEVGRDSISTMTVDEHGVLTRFHGFHPGANAVVEYGIGDSNNLNLGYDRDTGIGWGRWQGGVATAGDHTINLGQQSLHWIYGPPGETSAALPITGSAHYSLIGNTEPTDNLGNVGVLGSASLSADFTNQMVTNDIALSISQQVWTASGTVPIVQQTSMFGGHYSNVNANGVTNGTSGSFAGFFVSHGDGMTPSGAGLSYNLNNGSGTSVSGTAAFGSPTTGGQTVSP